MPEPSDQAAASEYLRGTEFLDKDHPEIVAFASGAIGDATSPRERAIRLYYRVRDSIRYDPYTCRLDPARYRASKIVRSRANFCVPKALLLTTLARTAGIPARLGYADVRNHLASDKLLEALGTDVFAFHGYAELFLDGQWVKATPVFNIELCERLDVLPLEFDGTEDSIFHPFDAAGKQHMEYIRDRGTYADFPFEEMCRVLREAYGPRFGQTEPDEISDEVFEHEAGSCE